MMTALFLLFSISVVLIFTRNRKGAITFFFITFVLAVLWLFHHASSVLNIQL